MKKTFFLFSLFSILSVQYGCESHRNEEIQEQQQDDSYSPTYEPIHTEGPFPEKGGPTNQ